jgi:hypothetical protein
MLQQKEIETPAVPPSCGKCSGLGNITSYFVVVSRKDACSPIERQISREEFNRRMEADLKISPGFKTSVPVKRIRACQSCPPPVNRERKNYG